MAAGTKALQEKYFRQNVRNAWWKRVCQMLGNSKKVCDFNHGSWQAGGGWGMGGKKNKKLRLELNRKLPRCHFQQVGPWVGARLSWPNSD